MFVCGWELHCVSAQEKCCLWEVSVSGVPLCFIYHIHFYSVSLLYSILLYMLNCYDMEIIIKESSMI